MAKTKISEFSTTAGNNTDINSINIAEGCAPSGINDAIRELMRQLKEFQTGGAGDSVNSGGDFSVATNKFTVASASGNTAVAGTLGVTGAATLSSTLAVTGTTTLTGALVANGNATLGDGSGDTVTVKGTPTLEVNPTLSGGTANGVLYLNGSKVATSGSALTFDGTKFGIGGTAIQKLSVFGTNSNFHLNPDSSGNVYGYAYNDAGAAYTAFRWDGVYHAFLASGTEAMRLTSTGLGIGTSSPASRLTSKASANNYSGGALALQGAVSGTTYLTNAGGTFYISNDGSTDHLVMSSSGNLGLGVTPSASSACVNMEFGGYGATLSARNTSSAPQFALMSNAVGNWYASTYKIAGKAAMYLVQGNDGSHSWHTAGTGTAGDAITFTQAMTLFASGGVSIGNTSDPGGVAISVSGNVISKGTAIFYGDGADNSASVYATGGPVKFYANASERARIDSSGNFMAGRTSALAGARISAETSSGSPTFASYAPTTGTEYAFDFVNPNGIVGSITTNGSATLYNTTSDQRLKENIADAPEFGSVIDSIKVRSYDWKADSNHQRAGFIAQELVTVAPEAVHQPVDPEEMMAVDYSKLVPMLVKEIQSLRKRLADAGIA